MNDRLQTLLYDKDERTPKSTVFNRPSNGATPAARSRRVSKHAS
jgi:hypothetical protein